MSSSRSRAACVLLIAALVVAGSTASFAQRAPRVRIEPNVPYDGRFTFVRLSYNFEHSMRQVLPEGRIVRLDVSHPIFNSFFHIKTLDGMTHPDNKNAKAEYLGIYEDNDPKRRLLVIINYNNDIGDYMEWSGQGWYAVNLSNDAYKLATNYIVYGLSH